MAQNKRTRPSRRKRVASRAASSPQAPSPGATETGKTQSSPAPRVSTRMFDRFSGQGALAALALGLLAGVCYLPAILWGGFVWDDPIWFQSRAVLEWSGLGDIWSWPSRIHREAHYWPLTYTTFWLEHKMWGLEAGRLSRGQRAAAPAELPAGVAFAAVPGRSGGLGCGGRVRRAPDARGVGGLDHRAQGRAFRSLLPGCRAGLAALPGTAAALALRTGPAAVRGGAC